MPTTTERGYGAEHQAERERWRPAVEAGETWCAEPICLMGDRWIEPGTPWDLAHDRVGPAKYLGPAHERCNRSEGARWRDSAKRHSEGVPLDSRWWRP